MRNFKRLATLATVLAMVGTSTGNLTAQEYTSDTGGVGYEESWVTPSLTPYIALVTVVAIAIVAIAVRHNGGGGSHSHSTSSSSSH